MEQNDALRDVTREIQTEIVEHMRDFQKYAPTYLAEYVESIIGPQTIRRPAVRFHPKLAEFIRDVALESRAMERRKVA